MKTKPKRHKALNTFKFQTFSERISSIDIDVFHKVKHPYEEDDEDVTHYAQALTKWTTENFSPGYYELRKNLPGDVTTLPQLLVQKDDIMKALISHLKSCEIESLQPALELIVAVAKDLRKEFFPYFNDGVLQECIRLLDTREVEQIEWVFTCLAHLFKYLWANIVKNINIILPQLLPLLSSSRPNYINNFAAESFAFVARKVRDKLQFLMLSLKNVKVNPDELDGVSKLFFEVVKGVGNQFHSCTEEFLAIIFKQLDDRKLSELVFEISENLMLHVTSFITSKTNITPVWNILMKIANEFHSKWQKNHDDHESENLTLLLKLLLTFITGREVILSNPQEIADFIMNLATDDEMKNCKNLHQIVLDVVLCLLTSNKISSKLKNTNNMIVKVLGNINDEKLAAHFTENIVKLTQYENIVFREFIKFVISRGLNEFLAEFLAKIVYMKTNFLNEAECDKSLAFYILGLKSVPTSFIQFLVNKIMTKISENNIHQVENTLHSIIVLSYINRMIDQFIPKCDKFLKNLCTCIESTENTECKAKLLYSLLLALQYRLRCSNVEYTDTNNVIVLVAKYVNSSDYLCSLRILDNLAKNSAFDCLSSDDEKTRLIDNLSSPFHKVRLFSSHVLSKMNLSPVFEQISEIENIFPSIETYRDKLQRLQKFECNEFAQLTEHDKRGALKFLFGNLYINFLYMWEPTQKLIQSYLENDPEAWKIFVEEFQKASMNDLNSDKVMNDVQARFNCEYLKDHFYQLNGVDDRPDFFNVRCLLLNVINGVKNYSCIDKNFVAEIFLNFYKSEYTAGNSEYDAFCNVKSARERVSDEDQTETGRKSGKNYNKLFIVYLKLISNLSSQIPKKFKSDVFDTHFELLSNGNSEIQKYAVDFICRVKDMKSYKERLSLLTNDNSIKDQLLNIKIDLNSNAIPEQDVPYFMKIVLKILFGKIRKKSAINLRDAMYEFLMSCKNDDVIFFFDMIFKEFSSFVKDPCDPVIKSENQEILERTLSPSWILNYSNHAAEILKRCGSLLQGSTLKYLLRILFKCTSNLVSLHGQKPSVHPCYYGLISKIRVNVFETVIYFLENVEYIWSQDEINALFRLYVDPWIEKIPEECLQSPNPLMKLFIVFTKNPRYFPLLAKKSRGFTALEMLMGLLNNDKVYFNVKNSLVEIIERLLTLEDDFDDDNITEFIRHDDLNKNKKKKNQRYGTILLMPFISSILQYLQVSLSKRYIKLNGVYMLILKRISEFGLNQEASTMLLNLLLPILRSKVGGDDEVVIPLLDTIINLFKTFKNHDKFENYLLQIAYLFGVSTAYSVRKSLCELVSYISDKTNQKFIDSGLICGLNLNDAKYIDQPDYAGRLEALKSINLARDNQQISMYTGIFIVYNCFYVIKTDKDIALRDHSGLCLKNLCPALCKKYADKKELGLLLNDILLPLIKEGIHGNNENYQQESLLLLGHMARECKDFHPVFRDLHPLTDGEHLESDFFENILHLQNFRRIKALKRFSEIMSKQVRAPAPYALTFLFPLVTGCLLSPKLSNEHALINCAIEALKIICHLSTWRHYEKTLKFYLMEMRKNVALRKQAIRIVSTILDSFHFDISQADQTNVEEKPEKNDVDDGMEMDVDETTKVDDSEMLPVVQRTMVLCRSDATRVFRSIKSFLIPSLDRVFMTYDDSEQYHKLSKKDTNNDKEEMAVLSIPIAYAAVKLIKKLPKCILDEYISTIFLKLSTYLKSRLLSIRLIARETMQNILIEIGPKYLPRLVSEMMSILTKGFQIHVLVFTCHAILEKVKDLFAEGEIDACIDPILEICIVDLFGKLSEEKEITKISSKTPEAKGNKSYNMLGILSEHISQCHVLDLILPLKEILAINMSTKTVNKVRRCLQYIALGLTKNQFISTESLLELAYGVSNDCIPELTCENENNKIRIETKAPDRPDSLLIPEEPRKLKPELTKSCARTNAHVIIEFGLELLESMLKREQLKPNVYRERLDPFAPMIKDCLHSQHIKLRILSLKSLVKLFRKGLPSLNDNINDISDSIFEILGEYSSPAMTGDNAELLMSAAKAALVLVHDMGHQINNDQLRIMLFVAEDLLKNVTHYGTGFSLIRAVIKRKYNIPEVHTLMKNISELSIRSYSEPVRAMAREVYYKYIIDYPLGKKLRQYVMFYVSQLKYDQLDGRKSALEMLTVLVKVFPMDILSILCDAIYVELSCRLNLEESPECKKMVADCLALMIGRVKGTKEESSMFDTAIIWLKESKISVRKLAVQILGIFASTLGADFESKLDVVLPLVENQLHNGLSNGPGKFVRAPVLCESEDTAEKDHLLFQTLNLYRTLLETCPVVLTDLQYIEHVNRIGESCLILLGHSHEWVRLGAAQILGIIFKHIDINDVTNALKKKSTGGFLRDENAKEIVKSLCLNFCDQLAPGHDVTEQLLRQTMKNLLYLAETLTNLKTSNPKDLSLIWLLKRLTKQVTLEVSNSPQKYTVRTMVFNWFAALSIKLNEETLSTLLPVILTPVIRELATNDEQGVTIRRVAKEVLKFYREKIPQTVYDEVITKVQRILDIKKAKRKANLAHMAITDPEKAARRKVKSQLKKKEQKKRRLEKLRKRKFKSGKKFKPIEISDV